MHIKKINDIFNKLYKNNPQPKTDLKYVNRFTFLISVILSAQATDISVNKATKYLFKIVKTPDDMVVFGEKNLKRIIKTIGLYNSKAKNIIKLSKILLYKYKGKVPKKFNDLISLPGVGNKTASVYQNVVLRMPRIAVDTHVYRVANRVGFVNTKTANLTQLELEKTIPKKWLLIAHHLLILHGRYICKARNPHCKDCVIFRFCEYKNKSI